MLVTARLWKRRKETVPTGSLETREGRKNEEKSTTEHFLHKLTSSPHPCIQGLVSLTLLSGTDHCIYRDKHKE